MVTNADLIRDRYDAVHTRVANACAAAGRDPADVRILVVTKAVGADVTRDALEAGITLAGESRVQELIAKQALWHEFHPEIHFIGTLQTNKIAKALPFIDCLHTVDRPALIDPLAHRLEATGRTLDVFIQVNVSGEASKAGVDVDHAVDFAHDVARHEALHVKGFMTIAAPGDQDRAYEQFRLLAGIRDAAVASGDPALANAHELSMGMSDDLEPAIAAGATTVRIGTAIVGPRPSH